jgi:hypothetical protein
MPRPAASLFLLVGLAALACSRVTATAEPTADSAAVPELAMPVPHVVLSASAVTLDGEPAGTVPTAGTVIPVAELLTKLRVRRATALSESKDAPTDPRATVEVADGATARALKILLETASRGNFPATTLVVARGPQGTWSRALAYDVAVMERPRDRDDGAPPLPPRVLVTVRDGSFAIEARTGRASTVPEHTVPRADVDASVAYPRLTAATRDVLAAMPRAGSSREVVLFVPDAMPVSGVRPIVDAVAAAEPGLTVRLHRDPAPPPAEGPRKGAIVVVKSVVVPDGNPPERVFYGLRSAQAKLRGCYEAAHADHRALRGLATVRFSIAATGEISGVKLDAAQSTANDATLASCLGDVLGGVTLASAAKAIDATVKIELDWAD